MEEYHKHKENQISFSAEILALKSLSIFGFLSPVECQICPLKKSAAHLRKEFANALYF